jgi:Zn-finger nucleic acid-binding protein
MIATTLTLVCPDHKTPLLLRGDGNVRFYACARCMGFWLSKAHLSTLRITDEMLERKHLRDLGFLSKRLRKCPECKGSVMMTKQVRGVEIDVCTNCLGIWLDAGEFRKLSGIKPRKGRKLQHAAQLSSQKGSKPSRMGHSLADGALDFGVELAGEAVGHGVQLIFEVVLESLGSAL